MAQERIYLSSPALNGLEMQYINEAFDTNWIAPLGKNVDEFERELCAAVGSSYAAALNSGTAAIHMALKAANVGAGDIVFCSSLTFAASCNPIVYLGAVPVFIDSERDSWNMSVDALRKAFKKYPRPKAIVVVNLYGVPAKLDEIAQLCAEHDTVLIEDAAESLGAAFKGHQTGTFGKYGTFSFNGNKIITTSGGGMVVSQDEERIAKIRFWSTQAREPVPYYQHRELGYNYRLSNICAGIGRGQLRTLKDRIERKKKIYEGYKAAFNQLPMVRMNPIPTDCEPNYWLSCMTIEGDCSVKPADVIAALEKKNIEARHIWKPMDLQPFYKDCAFFGTGEQETSVGADIFEHGLCLPSDLNMTDDQQNQVIEIVKSIFERS